MVFRSALYSIVLSLSTFSLADSTTTLDQLLLEIQALRSQIDTLESRISTLEGNPASKLDFSAVDAQPPKPIAETPSNKQWYKKFGINLEKADKEATGKWTEADNWKLIKEGMLEEEVIEILGEPNRTLETLKKHIDHFLIYRGYINNQTLKIQGRVKIYRDKVAGIEIPELLY